MTVNGDTSNYVRLRVLVGPTFIPLFVSEREYKKLMSGLKSCKEEWLELELSGGNSAQLKLSDVSFVELVSETGKVAADGTIPIKRLADFAGVHPMTITRSFPETLKQVSDGSRKFRRATRETANKLIAHLTSSGKDVPTMKQLDKLFGEPR
jgi:hypothetical protein